MNDIVYYFLITVFILIAFICGGFVVTEFKILIIMLKIKRCERLCKKARKELKALDEKRGKEE